jgi:MFS family permease
MESFVPRSPHGVRSVVQWICLESAFGLAYETWVGPSYLSGLAGELGLGIGVVTLITAVPFLGQIGQLSGFWIFRNIPSIRRHTLTLSWAGRMIWAIPLLFALGFFLRSTYAGVPFPTQRWFYLVAACACFSSLSASASATGWMAWTRELIPARLRGRFFGMRQMYVMCALVAANLMASFWVGFKPRGYPIGFGILAVIAILAGAISTYLLSQVPDVETPPPEPGAPLELLLRPLQDAEFRKILVTIGLFNCSVSLAAPYYPYFFTKSLGVPMSSVAVWAMAGNVGCLLASGFWGRVLDRVGDSRKILFVTSLYIALAPLPYALGSPALIQAIAPLEHFAGGAIAAGTGLATTTLIFASCPKNLSPYYFSVFLGLGGIFGLTGTFLGGTMARWLLSYGGFSTLFALSAALRLVIALGLIRGLANKGSFTEMSLRGNSLS